LARVIFAKRMDGSRTYFKGLNSLRFFAAIAVVLTHVELVKKLLYHECVLWLKTEDWIIGNAWQSIFREGPPKAISWLSPFVTFGGYFGVIFFFVLSGFLITYLLLQEKERSQTIGIKNFYIRRILRIWPIYFLLIFLGFFVFPHIPWFEIPSQERVLCDNFWFSFITYATMIPNFGFAYVMESIPNLGQLWSIGVEEQFYLFWPVFIYYSKKYVRSILILIALLLCLKIGSVIIIKLFFDGPKINPDLLQFNAIDVFQRFLSSLKFEAMAIGGLGACLLFEKRLFYLNIIFHKTTQTLAILALPAVILFTPTALYKALYLLLSIPCLIIIMNVGCNAGSLIRPGNRLFNYLGKISYGIYMYHLACIALTYHLVDYFSELPFRIPFDQNLLIYTLSVLLTILVSALSYRFIERPFIQRKEKYAIIKSGEV
jgi:peptidoglycan/LPS O-acetylase OafA/YrhL